MVAKAEDNMDSRGSPASVPVIGSANKQQEWSNSGLNRNLSNKFGNTSSDEGTMIDIELDEAVQIALGNYMDDTASQSTESGVYTHEEISVSSEAKVEYSSMSAVQQRLERRKKKAPPTMEEIQRKHYAAHQRRKTSVSYVTQRASEHYKEAKATAQRLESKTKSDSESIFQKLEGKLNEANERKQQHIQSIVTRNKEKVAKIELSDSNSVQSATQDVLERKLERAAERRELHLQKITNKLQQKMERVSRTRNALEKKHDAEKLAMQEKHERKLSFAFERKESHMKDKNRRMQSKMDKISENKRATEMKLKALGQKFAQKMTEANARKNISTNENKIHRPGSARKTSDEDIEAKRLKLEEKLFYAAERKQDQLDAKAAKAAAYNSTTVQRGLEAIKKREEVSDTSIMEEEKLMCENIHSSISIGENKEASQDPATPSVISSTSKKSNVQIRLEQWQRPTPTKQSLDAKLHAAENRRKLAILDVQEKADITSKYDKASKKVQSTNESLKKLEQKFAEKMLAANKRKEDVISKTVEKAIESSQKKTADVEKVSAMKEKLENKLLAALERRENIIESRSSKAAVKVSLSTERGQSALKQKDEMMQRMKVMYQDKHDSAKIRRKHLKQLEKEKREVNMMRRVMAQKMEDESENRSVSSLQQKLERELQAAYERKKIYLAAKASKAADHVASSSERGFEAMKQREINGRQLQIESHDKLESAAKRKAEMEEEDLKKKEVMQKRRDVAIELARQKKLEHEMISTWEARSEISQDRLPVVNELHEVSDYEVNMELENSEVDEHMLVEVHDLQAPNSDDSYEALSYVDINPDQRQDTYDSKKLAARNLLAEEIRRANEAKTREIARITEERKENERRERARREIDKPNQISNSDRHLSISVSESIDSNEFSYYEEEDFSISGLSAVRSEEESNIDRKKAQAALALAELDIKLSQIQIMQAILLAEEASMNGQSEFRTSEKSISDLNNVKVTMDANEDTSVMKKVQKRAKNFFNYTLKSAKESQVLAGNTFGQLRRNGIFKRNQKM